MQIQWSLKIEAGSHMVIDRSAARESTDGPRTVRHVHPAQLPMWALAAVSVVTTIGPLIGL